MNPIPYKSNVVSQTVLTGNAQEIAFKADFVPRVGPSGLKLLIQRLILVVDANITTTVTAVGAEDVWRAFRNLRLVQLDGVVRVDGVDGDSMRPAMIEKSGIRRIPEHADVAIAATTAYRWEFPIEMRGYMAYDGSDYSMPAELFNGLTFEGLAPGTVGIGIAGGTHTIHSASWYVIAECVEVDYCLVAPTDTIKIVRFGSNADLPFTVGGRLGGLFLRRPGAVGGLVLTAITGVQIDGLFPQKQTPAELFAAYARNTADVTGTAATDPGVFATNNPFTAQKAMPLIFGTIDSKTRTGPYLNTALIRTDQSSALTDLIAVKRTINGWNPSTYEFWAQVHRGERLDWRAKTRDKTRKKPTDWKAEQAPFIPFAATVPSLVR